MSLLVVSVNQLAQTIKSIMGADIEPIHTAPRPGDVRHSLADITKAKRLLGYNPTTDLQTGLEKNDKLFP